jgi:hypothetical protein
MDELRGPCALALHRQQPAAPRPPEEVRTAIGQMWTLKAPWAVVAAGQPRVMGQAEPVSAEAEGATTELPSLSAAAEQGGLVELDRRYLVPRRRENDTAEEVPLFLVFASELRADSVTHQSSLKLLALTQARLASCLPSAAQVQWHGDFGEVAWSVEAPATICVLSR